MSTSMAASSEATASPALVSALFLLREALSLNIRTISAVGIAPSNDIHDPRTVAALIDVSDKEWRSLETVRPPRENERSTSVDVATKNCV